MSNLSFSVSQCLRAVFVAWAALVVCGCASTPVDTKTEVPLPEGFETRAGAASYYLLLGEMALQKEIYDIAVD